MRWQNLCRDQQVRLSDSPLRNHLGLRAYGTTGLSLCLRKVETEIYWKLLKNMRDISSLSSYLHDISMKPLAF
jgi:hypothetical protein